MAPHRLRVRVAAERDDRPARAPVATVEAGEIAARDRRDALGRTVFGAPEPVISVHQTLEAPRRPQARVLGVDQEALVQPRALPLHLVLRVDRSGDGLGDEVDEALPLARRHRCDAARRIPSELAARTLDARRQLVLRVLLRPAVDQIAGQERGALLARRIERMTAAKVHLDRADRRIGTRRHEERGAAAQLVAPHGERRRHEPVARTSGARRRGGRRTAHPRATLAAPPSCSAAGKLHPTTRRSGVR